MADETTLTPDQLEVLQRTPIRIQVQNENQNADEAASTRRRPILEGARRTLSRATGSIGGAVRRAAGGEGTDEKEQREVRKALTRIATQGSLTVGILQKNADSLNMLATENDQVSQLLDQLDETTVSSLNEVTRKLTEGEEISPSEARFFTEQFKTMTDTLNEVGVKLEVDLRDISKKTSELIQNDALSLEDRRKILDQTIKQLDTTKMSAEQQDRLGDKLDRLKSISSQQTNISGDLLRETTQLLNDIGDDTTEIKTEQTLQELNSNLDAFSLTSDELNNTLNRQTESGKSFEDIFKGGLRQELGQGLLGFGLSALGLGGLEQILPLDALVGGGAGLLGRGGRALGRGAGGIARGIGRGAGRVSRGAGGILGRAGGALGRGAGGLGGILGGGARLLGKIALPLAAIMSIFDFAEGFTNAAEVAGLEPGQIPDLGTKVQAGISSVLSGLTFGLLDAKEIFANIDEGINFLFGEEGLFPSSSNFLQRLIQLTPPALVFSFFDKITGGTGELFGKEGFFARVSGFLSSIVADLSFDDLTQPFKDAWDGIFGENGIISKATNFLKNISISNLFGGSDTDGEEESGGFFSSFSSFFGSNEEPTTQLGAAQEPIQMENRSADLAAEDAQRERIARETAAAAAERQSQNFVPVEVQQPRRDTAPPKITQVDDTQLMIMNSLLLE